MKKIRIVLIPLDSGDRKTAEHIENCSFLDENEVKERINEEEGKEVEGVEIYTLTDFTVLCNDELFAPDSFWISYVSIEK
jgi:hypothetical protein